MQSISPSQFASLRQGRDDLTLIDVRTPGEYQSVHAEGAVNIPLDEITHEKVQSVKVGDGPVYLICRSGNRSGRACQQLAASGLRDVVNVTGGTVAWQSEGLPVVKGAASGGRARVAIAVLLIGLLVSYAAGSYFFAAWAGMFSLMTMVGLMDGCPICVGMSRLTGSSCRDGSCQR